MPRRTVDPVLDLPLVRQLVSLARSVGYTVERNDAEVPLHGGGSCIYEQKRICISSRFGELDALPVLIHEVAHALVHSAAGHDKGQRSAHEREANWVRESVLSALGLLRLLPAEKRSGGPPPSEQAEHAAQQIIGSMPISVTHSLARHEPQVAPIVVPASEDAVRQAILDAALTLGSQVFWIAGRPGIAGEHTTGAPAITVSDELPLAAEVAVLAHELAHAIQHPPGYEYAPPSVQERQEEERIAHEAAKNLLSRFGFHDYEARLESVHAHVPSGATAQELAEARAIASIIERAATMYAPTQPR